MCLCSHKYNRAQPAVVLAKSRGHNYALCWKQIKNQWRVFPPEHRHRNCRGKQIKGGGGGRREVTVLPHSGQRLDACVTACFYSNVLSAVFMRWWKLVPEHFQLRTNNKEGTSHHHLTVTSAPHTESRSLTGPNTRTRPDWRTQLNEFVKRHFKDFYFIYFFYIFLGINNECIHPVGLQANCESHTSRPSGQASLLAGQRQSQSHQASWITAAWTGNNVKK